jgi:hypothetical protein
MSFQYGRRYPENIALAGTILNLLAFCSEASHTYQTSNHYELDEGRNRGKPSCTELHPSVVAVYCARAIFGCNVSCDVLFLGDSSIAEHVEYSINHRLVSWCIHSSPVFGSMGTSGHAGRPVRCFLRGIPF